MEKRIRNVVLTVGIYEQIKQIAHGRRMTAGELIDEILRQYLDGR